MHGRPRKPQRAVDAAAAATKASKLRDLQSQLIQNHHRRLYTNEAITVSSKLLEINPETNTAWNYRKFVFQQNLHETTDSEHIKSLVNDELRVVEMALRQNPKSYGAWYHRKWILSQGLVDVDFDREFRLLDQLLKADSRNFHGWNYRRFVAKLKDVPEVEELEFTMDMINTNFSNYSSWHNRSALLSRLLNKKAEGFTEREKILTKEYELVLHSLFTDPNDQSGWFYYLWLLHQTITPNEISLISSWPPHESNLVLTANRDTGYYFTNIQKLPIVLYFNKTVQGVNSSSVTVNSMLFKNEDLVWKPLPPTKSEEAACWVTYLQFPDVMSWEAKIYVIEVKIDHSEAIMSSHSGSQSIDPLNFRFSLSLNYDNLEFAESVDELFNWNDSGSLGVESNYLLSSDQLKLSEDQVSEFSKWQMQTVFEEINHFEELSEENCKFGKLTLARLLIAQDAMLSHKTPITEKKIHLRNVLELFDDLMKLDPKHAKYYEDERSLVLLNQVTIDKKSSSSHFSLCGDYISSKLHFCSRMQLRSLSLTRIGYVERLLWVQVLDLSHNKLRSIEGLEALQLLACLNLRNNQICSFTALQPLKLLSYLKVLDISFNQIGAHPVDTTRYLFSPPSTRSLELDKEFLEDCRRSNGWEAVFLFRDLQLIQLDVKNNAVADENFRDLLTKVLPTLTWLDGERIRGVKITRGI
ncbi:hypothetical protein KSP40_PGU010452 [Platanthera guangdongensis]|uniref:Geranylgeranyl transferase type-2 subunit alpha n=1 Tax=Platanthera guangdongensis TaxID=2320717 RepID=A0ABR2MSD8_9ASPA